MLIRCDSWNLVSCRRARASRNEGGDPMADVLQLLCKLPRGKLITEDTMRQIDPELISAAV